MYGHANLESIIFSEGKVRNPEPRTVLAIAKELLAARELIAHAKREGFLSLSLLTKFETAQDKTDTNLVSGKWGPTSTLWGPSHCEGAYAVDS